MNVPDPGCLRIFRGGNATNSTIGRKRFRFSQTFCWSCSMFCIFDHSPQIGAMRMRSGACSLMISMSMARPLDVITSSPLRMSITVPTLGMFQRCYTSVGAFASCRYVSFFKVAGAAPALMELSMIFNCAVKSQTAASARFDHGVFGPNDIGLILRGW